MAEQFTTFFDYRPVDRNWVNYVLPQWKRVCGVMVSNESATARLWISFDGGLTVAHRLMPNESFTWDFWFGEGCQSIAVRSNETNCGKRVHAWGQR